MPLSTAAVHPLATLDTAAPLDDLAWLDEVVGEARVVALGETAHFNRECYLLRHRILRYLVARHGFGGYAMESGFPEGWRVDDWITGDAGQPGEVLATGFTSLMGVWTEMREHLEWLRGHNRTAARPVHFYGIDLGGSMVSLLPGLDVVLAYLAQADPEFTPDPAIRGAGLTADSSFAAPTALAAYTQLDVPARNALTSGIADLIARLTGRRLLYVHRTGAEPYERALRCAQLVGALDGLARDLASGDRLQMMLDRDAAMADTVEWVLRREDRIVLAAHNGHVQRCVSGLPGMAGSTPLGLHLADRLGAGYVVIGTTYGTGQQLNNGPDFYTGTLFTGMDAPEPDSLDGLLDASHAGPFAVNLRTLSGEDTATVAAATKQRSGVGDFYSELDPLDTYDALVHLPRVTAATPDRDAIARSPQSVREPLENWQH